VFIDEIEVKREAEEKKAETKPEEQSQ